MDHNGRSGVTSTMKYGDSENASVSLATSYMPNHIELQSDDDDEMMRHMQMIHGGRIKKYKKDKSLVQQKEEIPLQDHSEKKIIL